MENALTIGIIIFITILMILLFYKFNKNKYIKEIHLIKQDKLWDLFIEHYKEFKPKHDFTEAPIEDIVKIYCMEDRFGNPKYSCAVDNKGLCFIYVSRNPNMKPEYYNSTIILTKFNEEKSKKMAELLESYNM